VSAPASTDLNHKITASISSFQTEWSLLRALVGGKPQTISRVVNAPVETVRWKVLLDLADRHGVQPLLYQALSQAGGFASTEEMRVLAQLYQTNLHKGLLL